MCCKLLTFTLVWLVGATLAAQETLYNGIELPAEWPPHHKTFPSNDPTPPYLKRPPQVIPIDVGRQLLFDDFLIESTDMTRTHHRPVYHPSNPILKPETSHEQEGYGPFAAPFSGGIWFDPKDQLFKMWYMGGYTKHLCLATSTDGIHWTRPSFDVVAGTNIVLERGAPESNSVLMDLHEADPAKRFKYIYFQAGGTPSWAMNYRHSPDGIHWSDPVWRSGPCGDRTSVFYNPFRKKHVFLIRATANQSGRAKRYWETSDINVASSVQWPGEGANRALTPLWVRADLGRDFTRPEISDMPQLYHLDAMAYESVVIGLFAIHRGRFAMRSDGRPVQPGRPKCNELMIGYSRDGFHWHRPEHDTFLGLSEARGSWRWGNVQPVGSLGVIVGDQIYFYVSARQGDPELTNATEWIHDANVSTGLAVLRRDGFASMDAGPQTKTLTTRPLRFTGKHLFVNANVRTAAGVQGELRVEVLDRKGKVLLPYARDKCTPIRSNETLQIVSWDGVEDLASVAGQDVRFRFHMSHGELYSFWVAPTKSGASHGYVLGGGPGYAGHRDTAGRAAMDGRTAPAADAGPDQTIRDTDGDGRQTITLAANMDANSVNGKTASLDCRWYVEERLIGAEPSVDVVLPVGTHHITLEVSHRSKGEEERSRPHGFDQVTIHIQPKLSPAIPQDKLVMWLKADAIEGLTDGEPVSKWKDVSPNQLFSAQAEPAKRPVWIANGINDRPAVRFDGKDDSLTVDYCRGLLYSYYNSTLIAVVRTKTGGSIISHGHTNMSVSAQNGGTLSFASAYKDFSTDEQLWPLIQSTEPNAVPLGREAIVAMRRTSPLAQGVALFVNGKRDDNGAPIAYHPMNATNGYVGVAYPGSRNFFQGDIAEIILYGRAVSNDELRSIEAYLARKYQMEVDHEER